MQAVVALVAMAMLAGVDAPKPAPADLHGGRPLFEIVRQPRFIAAALCGIIAYPMMNLVMTSAPLAMKMCGLTVSDSNFGIQWHMVAMYGPSFFTGSLIARFGAPRIVALGLALEAVAATIGLTGITAPHFWATLMVLGVGWNFGFVGASALVLETHLPQEKNKVQAFNDFLVFGTMAIGSFSSGQLLANYGWSAVNLVVYPPVVLGLIVLTLVSFAKRRAMTLRKWTNFPIPPDFAKRGHPCRRAPVSMSSSQLWSPATMPGPLNAIIPRTPACRRTPQPRASAVMFWSRMSARCWNGWRRSIPDACPRRSRATASPFTGISS